MWSHAANQIEQIHSMLENGHRSVRVEKHSLVLWGITVAGLIILIHAFINPVRFPVVWQRILIVNSLITVVAASVAYWDFRLTRLSREARDESLSFVQIQLTKIWWFLIGLAILINIGMNLFGGGYLYYPILIILTGLGLFIHGLFSQQLLIWYGALIVSAGLMSIVLHTPFDTLRWFTVILFGAGLPFIAWLIDLPAARQTLHHRFMYSFIWLCLVIVPTLLIHKLKDRVPVPPWPIISLQDYQQREDKQTGNYIVRLPAGTPVPLTVNIQGQTLAGDGPITIPLKLAKPLEVAVAHGSVDGRYRVDAGQWLKPRRTYRIRDYKLVTHIAEQPGVQINLDFVLKILE